jgi:predicted HAD superfamily Cof-like phosphohydrolase
LVPEPERRALLELIEEEVGELRVAIQADDILAIADGLADIVYVAYGIALKMGIDLDRVHQEVHDSNMSKISLPLGATDQIGKIRRGPGYMPPDIAGVLGLSADQISNQEPNQ